MRGLPTLSSVQTMSDYFEWDVSRYGINVSAMDQEHEILIGHMNTLHKLHLSGATRTALGSALQELVSYTRKHFANEEDYMSRIGYPGLRSHAQIHEQMIERIAAFDVDFKHTGKLTDDFFAFLKMWLKAHICGIDVKYARL
jgi:hemerythrin